MAGPLALLGDAISSGVAEHSALKHEQRLHERARAERLADIADARAYDRGLIDDQRTHEKGLIGEARTHESTFRQQAWDQENKLYQARRFDALKDQLVKDGLLDIKDVGNPDAVNAAAQKNGREYLRAVTELAEYKAQIPSMIAAARGKATGIEQVLEMSPADIALARDVMNFAYRVVQDEIASDSGRKEDNAKNGAALLMANVGKLTQLGNRKAQLDEESERLGSGELNATEIDQIKKAALSKLPHLASKAVLSPKERNELGAEIGKQEQDFRLMGRSQLQQAARSMDTEMRNVSQQTDGIKIAIQTGAAAYMTPGQTTFGGDQPAATPKAKAEATAGDAAEFLNQTGGAPAPVPGATAAPAATVTPAAAAPIPQAPVALGGAELGGLLGAASAVGRGIKSAAGAVGSAINEVGKYGPNMIPYLVGGDQMLDRSLEAEMHPERYKPVPPPTWDSGPESPHERAANDRILATAPHSLAAIGIRKRRGIPQPVELQNSWVVGGSAAAPVPPAMAP